MKLNQITAKVSGKISGENHPFVAHYKFLRDLVADKEGVTVKLTIPSPSQLYFELIRTEDHIKDTKNSIQHSKN